MLEKPKLKDDLIIDCLREEYGLILKNISFLPLGADRNTAVYRVTTNDSAVYFVKLRCGEFDESTVTVPKYLSDQGLRQIIPPLPTRKGQLWARLDPFKVILYSYIEGHNGFEIKLSDRQWIEFGAALKKFHAMDFPPSITGNIKREKFFPEWRETVKMFLERINREAFDEPVAIEMAAFLKNKGDQTLKLVERAEALAYLLQKKQPEFILCHADIHGWNLLIDKNGALYMVDWDTLIYAPKERDLMFIGSGLGDSGYSPQEEEDLFYKGYGRTKIDQITIAYYRYERIIEDLAVYCQQIFLSNEGGEDRKQSLKNVKSNYLPRSTIERAYQSDKTLKEK